AYATAVTGGGEISTETTRGRTPVSGPEASFPVPAAAGARSPATRERRERIRRRDSLYRRCLGVADMWAVGLSLLIGTVGLGDDSLTVGSLAVPPLFVVLVKTLGLYDR